MTPRDMMSFERSHPKPATRNTLKKLYAADDRNLRNLAQSENRKGLQTQSTNKYFSVSRDSNEKATKTAVARGLRMLQASDCAADTNDQLRCY